MYLPDDQIFLVFGETGCGKSTLVNTLTNYFRDGSLDNLKTIIPTKYLPATEIEGKFNSEYDINDTTKAQTKEATDYAFQRKDDNKRLCIIDTPGLNDTAGIEQDDKNLEIILNAAIGAPRLSGIILVINGSSARLTHNIKSMMSKLKGSLPDTMMDNIIVVFTMCRKNTCNFKDLSQLGITPKEVFYINNTAFSEDSTSWDNNEKQMLQIEWDKSMNVCIEIDTILRNIKPIATEEFLKIKKLRSAIKSQLHQIRSELVNLQKVTEVISNISSEVKVAEETANHNQNFTVKKMVPVTKMSEVNYHSTICSNCNTICHEHCGLEFSSTPGSYFEYCSCMSNGICTECDGHCPASKHYHDNKGIINTVEEVDEIINEIQQAYLDSLDEVDRKNAELDKQNLLKNSIDKMIKDYMNKIEAECVELKSICKNFNVVDELNDLIYMLQKEAQGLTTVQARQLANETIESVKEICNKFSN
jgi:hypothetical protein